MNIRLNIEYEGTDFHGWQKQGNLATIQSEIERIIEKTVGHRIPVIGASRTDSGVHASGQVAHFECGATIDPERWSSILNFSLPPTIRIQESKVVHESFHAQKDALSKVYEYRILNRKCASALDRRVYFYPKQLRWDRIAESLPGFLGEYDFKAFQGAKADVKSTVRRVFRFELREEAGGFFRLLVEGNGFLKQMVRTMVGTVVEIGEGKRQPSDISGIIESRNRSRAGRTIPARGLCLMSVKYPLG